MKILLCAAAVITLAGCSKVDKEICWKQETKDAVSAIIGSQRQQIGEGLQSAIQKSGIKPSIPLSTDMKTSDYSLERIDNDTGLVDCSMKLSISLPYAPGKALTSEGKVFFSSREGEHGRYIEVSKTNAQSIAESLH